MVSAGTVRASSAAALARLRGQPCLADVATDGIHTMSQHFLFHGANRVTSTAPTENGQTDCFPWLGM